MIRRSPQFWLTVLLFTLALFARIGSGATKPGYGTLKVHFEFETAQAATSLVLEGTLGNIYPTVRGPSAHVSPVYPTLLALLRLPFGVHSQFALIGQSVMSCAFAAWGIALLPALGRAAGLHPLAGWLAGFAMALIPIPTFYDDVLGCWEQPLATLIASFLLLRFLQVRGQAWTRRTAICFGVVYAVLALTSPAVLPAVGLPCLLVWWRCGTWKQRGRWGAVMALAFLVVLTPWIVRNYQVFGTFIPLRSNFPLELAIGNHDLANGRTYITRPGDRNSPFFQMHPFTSEVEQERLREVGEVRYMQEKRDLAMGWIRSHPQRFLELCGIRFALFFAPTPDLWANAAYHELRSAITTVFSVLGLIGGLILVLTNRKAGHLMLLVYVLGAAIVYTITHIDLRYRAPANGVLSLLAADVLLVILARLRGR